MATDGARSSVVQSIRAHAVRKPDDVALVLLADGETEAARLSWADLDRRCRALATRLTDAGMAGERVLLPLPTSVEYVVGFLGSLYAKALPVPIYPPRSGRHAARLDRLIADTGAKLALTRSDLHAELDETLIRVAGRDGCASWAIDDSEPAAEPTWTEPDFDLDAMAYLQYSSGSTSDPRGVMVTNRSLLQQFRLEVEGFGLAGEADVHVTWIPLYHDMGLVGGLLQPLHDGAQVVLMPPPTFIQRPVRWLRAITTYRGTANFAPNFALDLCSEAVGPADRATLDLSSWHTLVIGGEPVRADTVDRFAETFAECGLRRSALCSGYGMAEATLAIISRRPQDPLTITTLLAEDLGRGVFIEAPADSSARTRRMVSGGWSWLDTEIVIVNPDSAVPCPDGTQGEIWCRGDTVAAGYWNQPDDTEATFRARLADGRGPYLRTGDLGVRYRGELYITGRLKDLIVIRGANHYPQDLEYTAGRSDDALAAERAAAFSVDVGGTERLVILHEVDRGWFRSLPAEGPDPAVLQPIVTAIRSAVAAAHDLSVDAVALLKPGTLPMTSSGKVRRREGRRLFTTGGLEAVHVWSVLPAENGDEPIGAAADMPARSTFDEVAEWVRATVGRYRGVAAEQIDLDAPFGDIGLDSMQMTRISGEVAERFGRRIDPAFLYDHPSIARVARALTGADDGGRPEPPLPRGSSEPVAVVGMACDFPGAGSVEEFWSLLVDGRDAVREAPADRPAGGPAGRAGFIDGIDRFDAGFFGISRAEADGMDPQQRLLLTVAWRALEDAGIPPSSLAGTATGVFVGISTEDYARLQVAAGVRPDRHVGTGTAFSVAANRISYLLDLRGPSVAVDTACSSSLVALHQAVISLQRGECDTALVAGVNALLSADLTEVFTQAGMLSSDGRCKTFDAAADGYGRAEGCGVVVLRRAGDAETAADHVRALIRGTAVNHGGRSSSLTAPNGPAQQLVLRTALAAAGVGPEQVGYIEAHGTGTSLGDPIEMAALAAVYDRPGDPLYVGSVKTNVGHLEAAAGVAGLIKTVLAVERGRVPAHLNLTRLNPQIALAGTRLRIPERTVDWAGPRTAAVSSFGFGGANAHAIIEQAPDVRASSPEHDGEWQLLTFSARDETALRRLAGSYRQLLAEGDAPFGALCAAAAERRQHFPHRIAVAARDGAEAALTLAALEDGDAPTMVRRGVATPRLGEQVAFVFTGQGAQYPGMAAPLYSRSAFREALARCDELIAAELGVSLLPTLLGLGRGVDLTRTGYAQPALFAMDYAAAMLWRSCGVEPDAVIGHSLGEYVAACVAGVLELPDAVRMVVRRGQLTEELCPPGGMLAVQTGPGLVDELTAEVAAAGPDNLAIAAVNGPYDLAVSGSDAALTEFRARWAERDVRLTRLPGTRAFHSELIRPAAERFAEVAGAVTYRPARIPVIGNLTGQRADREMTDPDYWVRQLLEPVRFGDGIRSLAAGGCRTFIECGPHPALTAVAGSAVPGARWLPTQRRQDVDDHQFVLSLADWYATGGSVDWPALRSHPGTGRRPATPVPLPPYPLSPEKHWFRPGTGPRPAVAGHPLLGAPLDVAGTPGQWFAGELGTARPWYLDQHLVFSRPVLPGAAMLEWALRALAATGAPTALRGVTFNAPLTSDADEPVALQAVVEPLDGLTRVRCFSRPAAVAGPWTEHVTAVAAEADAVGGVAPDPTGMTQLDRDEVYRRFSAAGLDYGPRMRGVRSLWRSGDTVLAALDVRPPDGGDPFVALLDSAFHGAAALLPEDGKAWLPIAVDLVTMSGPAPVAAWASVTRLDPGSDSGASFDVVLSTEAGAAFLVLRGLRLAPVDRGFGRTDRDLSSFVVRWRPAPAAATSRPRSWLVTGPDPDGVRDWVDQLAAAGIEATAAPWGAGGAGGTRGAPALLVRAGLPTGGGTDPGGAAELLGTDGLDVLRDHLARNAAAGATVVLCSTGAATPTPPGGRTPLSADELGQTMVTGLAKTVIAEYPQVRCVQVDLDPEAAEPSLPELLARAAGLAGSGHLAVRRGEWWEAELTAEPVAGPADVKIRADGTYLVTGGLGALGGRVAEWLVRQGARTLLLLGRGLPADRPAVVHALQATGARVELMAGDVGDGATLAAVESRLADMPPLAGIVHAAGTRDDAPLEHLDRSRVSPVLHPKVRGGWLMHQLAERHQPDLVILFSSLASVTGSAGQANYVLANTFLDGLAAYRRQRGLPAISVSWGPWAGAGMASDVGAALERSGLRGLAAVEALDALSEVLGRPAPHVALAAVDWSRHPASGPRGEAYTLLTGVLAAAGTRPDPEGTASAPSADQLATLVIEDPDRARDVIESLMAERVGVLLGWSRQQRSDRRPAFGQLQLSRLGIDSLMAVQLRNQFLSELSVDLPPQYLLGESSVRDVIDVVVRQLTLRRMTTVDDSPEGGDVEVLVI